MESSHKRITACPLPLRHSISLFTGPRKEQEYHRIFMTSLARAGVFATQRMKSFVMSLSLTSRCSAACNPHTWPRQWRCTSSKGSVPRWVLPHIQRAPCTGGCAVWGAWLGSGRRARARRSPCPHVNAEKASVHLAWSSQCLLRAVICLKALV